MTFRSSRPPRAGVLGLSRPWPAALLALTAVLVLSAGPVSAAPDPDGEGPGTTTSSTSTTTTTTRPGRPRPPAPPGPSTAPPSVEGTVPPLESVEPGPEPELELRLPSDSLAAATADLDRLQAALTRLRGRHDAARARRAEVAGALADARRDLAELRARQRDRAVQAYVLASSDAALDQLLRPNLRRERLSTLADAADRADRRRLVRLAADVAELTEEGERLDGEIGTLAAERRAVQEELDVVLAKVAAASATIGLAGDVVAAGIGPSAIARLARETDEAYGALTLATDPVVAAERAPRYDEARRRLAAELHDRTGVPAERFDAAWVASPVHALRAMYFALSQVGKPYVYATAGPATYDCSGLTKRAWQQNGISIPHFSGAQLHVGLPVSPEALRPGDLLTYGPGGSEHVVMYIGAGYTVEAKGRAWGVVVERADTNPGRFAGASRPLP